MRLISIKQRLVDDRNYLHEINTNQLLLILKLRLVRIPALRVNC